MDYKTTYQSQAFAKSNYLQAEKDLLNILRHLLRSLGYSQGHANNFIYTKDKKRVFLAIIDDIEQLNIQFEKDFLGSLTANDTIITDNFIYRPTLARVCKLPVSWFGIYHYEPAELVTCPDRSYSFKARRLDTTRLELFLELAYRVKSFDNGYVSLDCYDHASTTDKTTLAHQHFNMLGEDKQNLYQHVFEKLKHNLPYTNHDIEIDQAMQASLLNIVIETYSSDYTVALSEKTFRALITPRLWTLYSGRFTVKTLEQMGFDTLKDVVPHCKYDTLTHRDAKATDFIAQSNPMVTQHSWDTVQNRCITAAEHNKNLLADWQALWPTDFANWLPYTIDTLQS